MTILKSILLKGPSMSFDQLMRDEITVIKPDGSRNGPHKASVQGTKIFTHSKTIDVTEGDTVERPIGPDRVETYAVLEAEFHRGLHAIPNSWCLIVRKDGSRRPTHRGITIGTAGNVQIGDHNVQHISTVLQSLVNEIESSAASHEQKQQAKSAMASFLSHPAVTAVLGGATQAIVKTLMGQ
jgi:hypothetical protein